MGMRVGKTMVPEDTLLIMGKVFDDIFAWFRSEHQVGEGRHGDGRNKIWRSRGLQWKGSSRQR